MRAKPGTIIQHGEEERALGRAIGQAQSGPVHGIGHPQHIGQGQLESLGRSVQSAGAGAQAAPIQTRLSEPSLQRAQAVGPFVENVPPHQLIRQRFERQVRMLPSEIDQSLDGRRLERSVSSPVVAWPIMEAAKSPVTIPVIPFLQGGGGIDPPTPGLFGGRVDRA
jgi:hypothetical protein